MQNLIDEWTAEIVAIEDTIERHSSQRHLGAYADAMRKCRDELQRQLAVESKGIINDGWGNTWSETCPKCDCPTMEIIGPGKARCSECG